MLQFCHSVFLDNCPRVAFGKSSGAPNPLDERQRPALVGQLLQIVVVSTIEAQRVLDVWRHDYNHVRPHSALQDRTPVEMGALWVDSREPRESTAARKDRIETEIAGRFVTISPY